MNILSWVAINFKYSVVEEGAGSFFRRNFRRKERASTFFQKNNKGVMGYQKMGYQKNNKGVTFCSEIKKGEGGEEFFRSKIPKRPGQGTQ